MTRWVYLFVGFLLFGMTPAAWIGAEEAPEIFVSFLTPTEGDVVAGPNVFLWARQSPFTVPGAPVVFQLITSL